MADLPKVLVVVCVTPPPSVPNKKKKNHTNPQLKLTRTEQLQIKPQNSKRNVYPQNEGKLIASPLAMEAFLSCDY